MMIMIRNAPNNAIVPGTAHFLAYQSPSERPLRRLEMNRIMKSCTAPAVTTPTTSHNRPGR